MGLVVSFWSEAMSQLPDKHRTYRLQDIEGDVVSGEERMMLIVPL